VIASSLSRERDRQPLQHPRRARIATEESSRSPFANGKEPREEEKKCKAGLMRKHIGGVN